MASERDREGVAGVGARGERMGGRKGDEHFEDAVDDKCVSQ